MNNDGWGFLGAGTNDNRLAGADLQHNRQKRAADKFQGPARIITQPREAGGPMKHQGLKDRMDESLGARHGAERHHHQSMADRRHESEGMSHHHGHHPMHHHLEEEKSRHEHALQHHHHHLERHHGRHYNTQHGHDHYKY